MGNTASVLLKKPKGGMILCLSNSARYQRVTIKIGKELIVFQGSGEQVTMKTQSGEKYYPIKASAKDVKINLLFEFSKKNAKGPFLPARKVTVTSHEHGVNHNINLSSEDGAAGDPDVNDTFVIINYMETAG